MIESRLDNPPSIKMNNWGAIITIFLLALIASNWLMFKTWPHQYGIDGDISIWLPYFADWSNQHLNMHFTNTRSWSWLSEEVLNNNVKLEAYLLGSFFIRVALCLWLSIWLASRFYTEGGQDSYIHVAGPRLWEGSKAITIGKRLFKNAVKQDDIGEGIKIHPALPFPYLLERLNYLFLGAPRSGKTANMIVVMTAAMSRGDKMFCYDPPKAELTEKFYDKNNVHLIACTDKRSTAWAIARDCVTELDAKNIAERLIPAPEHVDAMWSNSAREVFTGILVTAQNIKGTAWGWEHINILLNKPTGQLYKLFKKHYPPAMAYVADDNVTTVGIMINLKAYTSFVRIFSKAWPKSWKRGKGISIRQWTKQDTVNKKTIIIQAHPELKRMSESLFSTLLSLSQNSLNDLPNSKHRKLWYCVDELGTLHCPDLIDGVSILSGKGSRYLLGLQDISMMVKKYGREQVQALQSMIATTVILRVSGAGETAKTLSDAIGEREVERPNISRGSNTTISYQNIRIPVVQPEQITSLPTATLKGGIHGFLVVSGINDVFKLRWPINTSIKDKAPDQGRIEADWVNGAIRKVKKTEQVQLNFLSTYEEKQQQVTNNELTNEAAEVVADVATSGSMQVAEVINDVISSNIDSTEEAHQITNSFNSKKDKLKRKLKSAQTL